tara:strand:+ start:257 stop:502 length:246 start_codon:yes stop_codon:yes gene_type:complete
MLEESSQEEFSQPFHQPFSLLLHNPLVFWVELPNCLDATQESSHQIGDDPSNWVDEVLALLPLSYIRVEWNQSIAKETELV